MSTLYLISVLCESFIPASALLGWVTRDFIRDRQREAGRAAPCHSRWFTARHR